MTRPPIRSLAACLALAAALSSCSAAPALPVPAFDPELGILPYLGAEADRAELAASLASLATGWADQLVSRPTRTAELLHEAAPVPRGSGMGLRAPARLGADEPLEIVDAHGSQTRPGESGTSVAEAGDLDLDVTGRTVRLDKSTSTTITHEDGSVTTLEVSVEADIPVCRGEDGQADVGDLRTRYRVVETGADGVDRSVDTVEHVGHVSRDGDAWSMDGLHMHAERTTPSGTDTADVTNSIGGFRTDGDWTPQTGSWDGASFTEGFTAKEVAGLFLGAPGMNFLDVQAALVAAEKAREEGGLCVRLEYDAHGVTSLGPGESVDIDVWVVDDRNGRRRDGEITAVTASGSVSPESAPSPASFSFEVGEEASAPFSVSFLTSTEEGGDSITLSFSTGYRFSGLVITASTPGGQVTQEWSGHVCGDPLTELWEFTQAVTANGSTSSYPLTLAPFPVGSRPGDYGGVPMIEADPGARDGEPPFRLYVDDVEPPEVFSPATQRVQARVVAGGDGVCD